MIAETILSLAERLLNVADIFRKHDQARRDQVAQYFDAISETLNETSSSLRGGVMPWGKCAEMQLHADKMAETIGDFVGKAAAIEYADQLAAAHNVERLYVEAVG